MDPTQIIERHYTPGTAIYRTLTGHSEAVARKALEISGRLYPGINRDFIFAAAMLHDIGIFLCHAPGIYCNGSEPYIRHGILGAELLRSEGGAEYEKYARVCERHTGAGLTRADIISQGLPLPHSDFLPETPEEKLICYADKFFSKSDPDNREKPLDKVIKSMERHGADSVVRFMALHHLFS